jgi:hypothetical protein
MFDLSDNDINKIKGEVNTATGAAEVGFTELVIDPIIEGFVASPTAQLVNFARSGAIDTPTVTAEEANLKYGLEGTPVAFAKGEMVSDRHAKYVSDDWADKQAAEFQRTLIEEKYGSGVAAVSSFAGNLIGSLPDPINLAMGLGTGAAMSKLGFYSLEQVSKAATVEIAKKAANQTITKAIGGAAIENLAVNTATEYTFGKLQEYATNQEISAKDRVFGILAGTLLGTGIQGAMVARGAKAAVNRRTLDLTAEVGADGQTVMRDLGTPETVPYESTLDDELAKQIKREYVKAETLTENYGEAAEQLVFEMNDHAIKSQANMVVYNPDYVKNRMDTQIYSTRSYQKPYTFVELDDFSVAGTEFYATSGGKMGNVYSDNPNFVNNHATREGSQFSKKDTIDTYDMSQSSILDKRTFTENKVAIVNSKGETEMRSVFGEMFKDELRESFKITIPKKLENLLDMSASTAKDFKELIDGYRAIMSESEFDIDATGVMHVVLDKSGFNGYHSVANAGTPNAYNSVYLTKPAQLAKAKKVASAPLTPFDPKSETDIVKKLAALEMEEFGRFTDPTQKIDYNPTVNQEAAELVAKVAQGEEKVILDNIASDVDIFLKDLEAEVNAKAKLDADGKPKVLDEVDGLRESLKAADSETTIKMLTNCLYKG